MLPQLIAQLCEVETHSNLSRAIQMTVDSLETKQKLGKKKKKKHDSIEHPHSGLGLDPLSEEN